MSKMTLSEKIAAALKLGDAGKINNFFERERRELERSIRANQKNIEAAEYAAEQKTDELRYKLEDAHDSVEAAYLNITPENVATNALQEQFSPVYWAGVKAAEDNVVRLEKEISDVQDQLKEKREGLEKQIQKLQTRISVIDGKKA
jgi:hypothetical protein